MVYFFHMRRVFTRVLSMMCLVAVFGAGCTKAPSAAVQNASKPITLNIWGVVDDQQVYDEAFKAYRALHPNVSINYRRLRLEEYEDRLVNGFAEDRGPDIFLIHNTWVNKYLSKIAPMPATTQMAVATVAGGVRKEVTWDLQTESSITLRDFKNAYADAVLYDALRTVPVIVPTNPSTSRLEERVMAAPIYVDTLALYYNKDLLNAAGIPTPPTTWEQFQSQVEKLKKVDAEGVISQAAVGMGTAYNVERSTDILTLLMMQTGVTMAAPDGSVTFHQRPENRDPALGNPALQAVQFYTNFADPQKVTYTWNAQQPNSMEAFIQGKAAFFLGYSYQYDVIRANAPRMNLGLSEVPKVALDNQNRNVANYWMWTVSKKSANQNASWNLLNYLMKQDVSKSLLANMKRPAARKALLQDQFADERLGVFASQVLTAQSWYRGYNPGAMEQAFKELIESYLVTAPDKREGLLGFAASKISQTYATPSE